MLNQSAEEIIQLINSGIMADERKIISLVGPNGCGKTRLLNEINSIYKNSGNCIFVSTERTGFHPSDLSRAPMTSGRPDKTKGLQSVVDHIITLLSENKKDNGTFSRLTPSQIAGYFCSCVDAVDAALIMSYREEIDRMADAAPDANRTIHLPPKPVLMKNQVEKIFEEIFGYKCEILNSQNGRDRQEHKLIFENNGQKFDMNGLSSGERQILMLSILSIVENGNNDLIIVDEPELFLNEARAIDIWGRVEKAFPASTFVYATHNVVFATRVEVSDAFIVTRNTELQKNDLSRPFPVDKLRQIVGTRVQLLRDDLPPIFCEDGMAKLILEDIVDPGTAKIVALAGCEDVEAAMNGERHWQLLRSSDERACGVLDRDLRSDREVEILNQQNLFCLDVNESEAVLLEPKILSASLSAAIGSQVTQEECAEMLVHAAAERLKGNLIQLSSLISRQNCPKLEFEIENYDVSAVRIEYNKSLDEVFKCKASDFSNAIKYKNTGAILKLFGSKEMYRTLKIIIHRKYRYQLQEPQIRYRENRSLIKPLMQELDWVANLKQQLQSRIQLQSVPDC
ncbi:ATP-binding cassette domain-containing protein [Methylobacterium aquaticum]|uniref:ATP-binding cassette domain-containing protein n=1 Tax=Methylobacterium aquaticum TaxID=270351 RepID=UPI003D16782C